MIKVKDQRIDDAVFAKLREQELSAWPTGKEVDLAEAFEYQKKLPDSKNFVRVLEKYKAEGKTGLYPRSGVPVIEEEIKLLRGLNEAGVRLFPFTTDSYTRNRKFDMCQKGIEESIRTGVAKLNGFPIVNHGVYNLRKVVESCEGAFDPRSSYGSNSICAEISFAGGMNCFPDSFFGWIAGYDKRVTPEQCIETAQYLGRLMGVYEDAGCTIGMTSHGWLPNGVFPMDMLIATQVLEALVASGQGARNIIPLTNFQGNINQDLAVPRVVEKVINEYLQKMGRTNARVVGMIGNQSPLFAFPQDLGLAFGYINYVAVLNSIAKLPACSVKTVDEATGVPSLESHALTYRSANWIFNVMSEQKFEVNNAEIELEEKMCYDSVCAIVDKVLELGDGDCCVGIVKALEVGVLDSPFSVNACSQDLCMGARDLQGACRFIDFGNIPVPQHVREFHMEKIHEREKAQGLKIDYKASIADFWSLSRSHLVGEPEKSPFEEEVEALKPAIAAAKPTIITGTSGVDSHVIGTKIVSRELRECGFNVVALGCQTSAEDFIKAAQETDAKAILITSLYGMAQMDLQGFRDKCIEAGLNDIILYIAGILGVGVHDAAEDEKIFKEIGFDRVYPPESDVKKSVVDLCNDLKAKGIM